MEKKDLLTRIILDPKIMAGKPVIRGTRLTVQFMLNLLAQGWSEDEIMLEYPGIIKDDIHACLFYASETLNHTEFMPVVEAL